MAKKHELWKVMDKLLDAVFVIDRDRKLQFANDSFSNLCDLPKRAIRSHDDISNYINLPEECWCLSRLADSSDSEMSRYREVDFSTKKSSGRIQVIADRIADTDLSENELYIYILRDVTVETRLHEKYKVQIASNERLIAELQANLAQTTFLRGLAQDLPAYADTMALLGAICKRMKGELGFEEAIFLKAEERDRLSPIGNDARIGSRMRDVLRSLEARTAELEAQGSVGSMNIEPFGPFWLVRIDPKQGHSLLLVASAASALKNIDYKSLFLALQPQICTLLDNRSLYIASITDQLTGLFNRRFFDSQINAKCLNALETANPVTLVLLDIDRFKDINDIHGHQVGDLTLTRLGELIRKRTRDTDLAARVGGEEFAVLLAGTSTRDAIAVAEDIRHLVSQLSVPLPDGGELRLTISCGVAGAPWPHETAESLYKAADDALYEAKRQGRNLCIVDDAPIKKAIS